MSRSASTVKCGRVRRLIVFVGLGLLAAGVRAFADGNEATLSTLLELDEITVTAQKRPEPLSTVPISMAALTREEMEAQGLRGFADLGRIVPGLNVDAAGPFGTPLLSIRSMLSNVGAATTGVYVNDVPILQRNDCACRSVYPQIFDLDRIEVLRGPQGTLYGAGSEGGTVRFITTPPNLESYSGHARAEAGSAQQGDPSYEFGAAFGGPVVAEELGFRASIWGREDGGYIDRISRSGEVLDPKSNERQTSEARLAMTWLPTSRLSVRPTFSHQRALSKDTDLYWEDEGYYAQRGKIRQPFDDRLTILSSSEQYQFDHFSLEAITSFVSYEEDTATDYSYWDVAIISTFDPNDALPSGAIVFPQLPDVVYFMTIDRRQRAWTQEVRLTSNGGPDDRLSWVTGMFWQHDKTTRNARGVQDLDPLFDALWGLTTEEVLGVSNVGPYSYYEDETSVEKQLAAFGDASYRFGERWKLTAGLRIARSEFSFDEYLDGPWNGGPRHNSGSQQETPITPKINLSYAFERGLVYAAAADGYRIGGANASYAGNEACAPDLAALGRTDAPQTYDADRVRSYELGANGAPHQGRLELAASAYWVDWNEIQGSIYMPTCALTFTTNLGTAVSRGVDVSATVRTPGGLLLGVVAGYNDAHYTETTEALGSVLAKKGDSLPTPSFTGALFAQYGWQLRSGHRTYARVDYNYSAAYDRTPSDGVVGADPNTRDASAIGLLSLRAGLHRNRWDLSLFADNLLGEKAAFHRTHVTPESTAYLSRAPRPRVLGLTLRYKYD